MEEVIWGQCTDVCRWAGASAVDQWTEIQESLNLGDYCGEDILGSERPPECRPRGALGPFH